MTTRKPHETEDEYFSRLDVEKKHKLTEQLRKETAEADLEQLKKKYQGHCPRCGTDLHTVAFRGFSVDKCFHCNGAFLTAEAFQHLCGAESHFLDTILDLFKFR